MSGRQPVHGSYYVEHSVLYVVADPEDGDQDVVVMDAPPAVPQWVWDHVRADLDGAAVGRLDVSERRRMTPETVADRILALSAEKRELTAQRDRARGIAVALEQQLAEAECVAVEIKEGLDEGRVFDPGELRYLAERLLNLPGTYGIHDTTVAPTEPASVLETGPEAATAVGGA